MPLGETVVGAADCVMARSAAVTVTLLVAVLLDETGSVVEELTVTEPAMAV